MLELTESLRTADHPRFLQMMQQLHGEAVDLTPDEQWHLHYLDAWQAAFEGDYAKADAWLQNIIEHSGDAALVAKSSALLMDDLGVNSRYEEAFTLANQLTTKLPTIKDRLARFLVLADLSQLLGSAGQYDLAITYARMMEQTLPPGETLCKPRSMQIVALFTKHELTSTSSDLRQGIDTCMAAGQPVFANTLWLVMGDLYLEENQPAEAIALLDRIAPSIKINQYYSHTEAAQVMRARAWWKQGDTDKARATALAALASSSPNEISESLRDAYDVLYMIEKKRGNAAAALSYYERYVEQNKSYLDDVSARSLAYQTVQQHMLAKKLEAEELSKQNTTLRLQQALDAKAVETGRLYIFLLLMVVASIAFWLYRLKRSQLRFKRLSNHDGLTGIFNHQYFMSEASRVLHALERRAHHACLVSIDLDYFKQVNDTYGHATGDAVLRHAVAVCQQELRPMDLFGRLGGEEFGLLLHGCPREQGMAIAHRIRIAIAETPMGHDGQLITISASVGLASTDASGYELKRMCMEADAALYRAKGSGRNRVIAHTATDECIDVDDRRDFGPTERPHQQLREEVAPVFIPTTS